jgi:hypothetical protein
LAVSGNNLDEIPNDWSPPEAMASAKINPRTQRKPLLAEEMKHYDHVERLETAAVFCEVSQ